MSNEIVFNLYHEARKIRVIFRYRVNVQRDSASLQKYSCQVQDNNSVFPVVNIDYMSEETFLERIKQVLEQGFVIT